MSNDRLLEQTNKLLRSELGFANKRVRDLTEEVADLDAANKWLKKELDYFRDMWLVTAMTTANKIDDLKAENAALQERPMKRRPTLVDTGHVILE
jgi:uncharacterized protein YeeX (DUF496 family)